MAPRALNRNLSSRSSSGPDADAEYEVEELRDRIASSRGSRLALVGHEFSQRWRSGLDHRRIQRYVIHPDNRWYRLWKYFILGWAMYSSFFTPLEFGFFRGLPDKLFWLDIAGQIAFLVDISIHFFLAYRDEHTYRVVYNPKSIAKRYVKSGFIIDLLGCLPWDAIYKRQGPEGRIYT